MAESLNPTATARLSAALRPDWIRTAAARRAAAGALVVLAAIAALRPDPGRSQVDVLVAAHDLAPGVTLTADDVAVRRHPAATVPDGAATGPAAVLGATLAGPARRGEPLTDVRLLGRALARSAAGPDARIVAVHPADAALADLVHPGDVVDVIAAGADPAPEGAAPPRIVAAGAVVVLVSPQSTGPGTDRVVLVALPAAAAVAVAGAALTAAVTLTLR